MKIIKKYLITLSIGLVILLIFLTLSFHYGQQVRNKNTNISSLHRPIPIKKEHVLTGNKSQDVNPYQLINANEQHQIDFAKQFLTNHFTYNTAGSYANNRAKSQKQMTNKLWDRVKNTEFSSQKNRIGESLISANRSTSNFISADAYIAPNTLPEHNMDRSNIPIYYLVTSSYTNNQDDNAESGKQSTLIKMNVDADHSLVSDYQVIGKSE